MVTSSTSAKSDSQAEDLQQEPMKSVDAKEDKPVSASKAGPETAAAIVMVSSNVTPISRTARINNADVVVSKDTSKPRYRVQSVDDSYEVFGVDAIWHNQYVGPETNFIGIRKQFECDINAMILMVAKHVSDGLYEVISMNASAHSLTVICGCTKMRADLPPDMFADPSM
ncbi:hypothetical protein IFR05_000374 [Cadophora sp. M221]|nr:hypothetical protein IFR05_000374 [Cadophora sp. M221]